MMLLGILGIFSTDAEAGNRTINSSGAALSWQHNEIVFKINPGGKHGLGLDAVSNAILDGAEQWALEGSWVDLVYDGESDVEEPSHEDGEQVVFFLDDWSGLDPNLLALTYVWSYSSGEIIHFDIAVNADDHQWTASGTSQENDLWNAMTHEFGHALGLDHSEDDEATMYAKTSLGETLKRDLAVDDLEMFTGLYGGTFPYTEVIPSGCSSAPAPSGWWSLLGLLGLCLRRRAAPSERRV
jgi:MYXO-CTERM domain-containing protein